MGPFGTDLGYVLSRFGTDLHKSKQLSGYRSDKFGKCFNPFWDYPPIIYGANFAISMYSMLYLELSRFQYEVAHDCIPASEYTVCEIQDPCLFKLFLIRTSPVLYWWLYDFYFFEVWIILLQIIVGRIIHKGLLRIIKDIGYKPNSSADDLVVDNCYW